MKLSVFLFVSLLLAGCAHPPIQPAPPTAISLAEVPSLPPRPVLKPTHLESSLPTSATLLTIDSWLDDYFVVMRVHSEKLRLVALRAHPEWASLLDALRNMEVRDEDLARYVFLYNHRQPTGGIPWANGNWARLVMPCSCGQIGRINTPEWERLFHSLNLARNAFTPTDPDNFWRTYRATIKETELALKPALDAELARLKPGFFRFMREPDMNAAPH